MLFDFYDEEINPGEIVKVEHFNIKLKSNTVRYFLYDYKENSKCTYLFIVDPMGNIDYDNSLNYKIDDSVSLTKECGWKWVKLGNKEEVLKEHFSKDE